VEAPRKHLALGDSLSVLHRLLPSPVALPSLRFLARGMGLVTTLESLFKGNGAGSRAKQEKMVNDIVAQKLSASSRPREPAAEN